MGSLNKLVIITIFIIALVFLGLYVATEDKAFLPETYLYKNTKVIVLGGVRLFAEIADNKEKWLTGLSDRESLAPRRAMLFIFPKSDFYKITVEKMRFPIDVFWVNKDGIIVDIWKYASPDSEIKVRAPSYPAKYIIETVADFAEEYDVQVGDKVYN